MSLEVQNLVTELCVHLKDKEQKSNEYIVNYVRRGTNDCNRTKRAREFSDFKKRVEEKEEKEDAIAPKRRCQIIVVSDEE